jgi:hypothetical protein
MDKVKSTVLILAALLGGLLASRTAMAKGSVRVTTETELTHSLVRSLGERPGSVRAKVARFFLRRPLEATTRDRENFKTIAGYAAKYRGGVVVHTGNDWQGRPDHEVIISHRGSMSAVLRDGYRRIREHTVQPHELAGLSPTQLSNTMQKLADNIRSKRPVLLVTPVEMGHGL